MSKHEIILPGEPGPYRDLLSKSTLPAYADGHWEMDAPELPDDLRELYWIGSVGMTAVIWLLDQRPERHTMVARLADVMADLVMAVERGTPLLRQLGPKIRVANRQESVPVGSGHFLTYSHGAIISPRQCVACVREQVGVGPTVAQIAADWACIYPLVAPEVARHLGHPSKVLAGMLGELQESLRYLQHLLLPALD